MQFNLDDVVICVYRNRYWSAIEEKFVTDRNKASHYEWWRAKTILTIKGKWIKWNEK